MNENNFDSKKASHYEDIACKAVYGYDQLFTMALSILVEKVNETANVLVVGCGTGMELITYGNKMNKWKLVGVDPSEEMIKISKQKIDSFGLSDRIKLHHGFTDTLPEEENYDAASLIFVLRFIPDDNGKLALLKNVSKRLKSGAEIIIIDQYGNPNDEYFQMKFNAWKNFMRLNDVPAELVKKISNQALEKSFFTKDEIISLFSNAGFGKTVRIYDSFFHSGWIAQKN